MDVMKGRLLCEANTLSRLFFTDAVIGAMFQEDCSVNNICISGYACEIDLQICRKFSGI